MLHAFIHVSVFKSNTDFPRRWILIVTGEEARPKFEFLQSH